MDRDEYSLDNGTGSCENYSIETFNDKFVSGTKMKLRNKKCNLYIKSSTLKLGKGVCLTTEISKKCAVIEHFCTNEVNCIKLISKRISAGDLTELSVYDLNDKKFNEKYSILHSVVS